MNNEDDVIFMTTVQLYKHFFGIKKNHHLITIPYHSTTIPLEKLNYTHNVKNYPNKCLNN